MLCQQQPYISCIYYIYWLHHFSYTCLVFIMTPKCTKFTNVSSNRPCWVHKLETKLQVIKDYNGGKISDDYCSSLRHFLCNHSYDLEEQQYSERSLEGSASIKEMKLKKIEKGLYQRKKLLVNLIEDHTEIYASQHHVNHSHSKNFVCIIERDVLTQIQFWIYLLALGILIQEWICIT